jgi:hypothetical protein
LIAGFIRNSSGAIVGFGIDHFNTTPASFYAACGFILGVGWLLVAYLALWVLCLPWYEWIANSTKNLRWLCNFRQK